MVIILPGLLFLVTFIVPILQIHQTSKLFLFLLLYLFSLSFLPKFFFLTKTWFFLFKVIFFRFPISLVFPKSPFFIYQCHVTFGVTNVVFLKLFVFEVPACWMDLLCNQSFLFLFLLVLTRTSCSLFSVEHSFRPLTSSTANTTPWSFDPALFEIFIELKFHLFLDLLKDRN